VLFVFEGVGDRFGFEVETEIDEETVHVGFEKVGADEVVEAETLEMQ
jgi:hypothetical protein